MNTLLSIDTSGPLCGLAIHCEGRWYEDTQQVERMHNMVLLEQLQRLAARVGVSRRGFDVVAFGAGPGSFTGIRIAAAVAQGIGYACGARVVPVSSSRALATSALARRDCPAAPAGVLTITRSRRDAYYLAGFDLAEGGLAASTGDRLYQGAQPPDGLPGVGWVAVGDRPDWWDAVPSGMTFLDGCQVSAVAVGELALVAAQEGRSLAPAEALPIYVSGDSPWRPAAR